MEKRAVGQSEQGWRALLGCIAQRRDREKERGRASEYERGSGVPARGRRTDDTRRARTELGRPQSRSSLISWLLAGFKRCPKIQLKPPFLPTLTFLKEAWSKSN
jgi:hypothetical protein